MSTQSTQPPAGGSDPRSSASPSNAFPAKTTDPKPAPKFGEAPLQPVIDDAAAKAQAVAKDVKETAQAVVAQASQATTDLSADLKQAAQSAQRAAKAQASEFAADLGHELSQTADAQKVRGADAMQGFARAFTTAAQELQSQSPQVARYVRDAAGHVETLSQNLRGKSVNDLVREASKLARSQPAVFLAGAVASGFMLSRFLKSSASRSEDATSAVSGRSDADVRRGGIASSGRTQGGN